MEEDKKVTPENTENQPAFENTAETLVEGSNHVDINPSEEAPDFKVRREAIENSYTGNDGHEAKITNKLASSGKSKGPKVFYNAAQAKASHQLTATEQQTLKNQWQKLEVPEDDAQAFLPDYFFAGFWMRSFAFLLDLLCIAAIRTSTLGLVYRLLGIQWQGGFLGVYNLAAIVIYLVYFTLLTKLNHGQTIGKMVFGLRVVSLNGAELTWGTVLTREAVCRFILMRPPFLLGYLPTAFTRKKQHVGDYFAETSVVTVNLVKAFNKELA